MLESGHVILPRLFFRDWEWSDDANTVAFSFVCSLKQILFRTLGTESKYHVAERFPVMQNWQRKQGCL